MTATLGDQGAAGRRVRLGTGIASGRGVPARRAGAAARGATP